VSSVRIAIVGGSGYTGLEAIRIVLRHPQLELVAITSEQRDGLAAADAFPGLRGLVDLRFEKLDAASLAGRVDAVLCCLPDGPAAQAVAAFHRAGVTVVDLAGNFRLLSMDDYTKWYGVHAAPELFGKAVYGIPELHRAELAGAKLAAAAGCYPTAALLPLVPLLRAGLIETTGLVIDAKSGVSGAGRTLSDGYLYAELDGNPHAYKVGSVHRHVPEMEQEASAAAGESIRLSFVPQLLPTTRGMLATVIARPRGTLSTADVLEVLGSAYAAEPFVRVLPEGELPQVASVRGTNFCDVAAVSDERSGTLLLLSSLDNLVKGASGQMVQCLNVMCGFDETEGLLVAPLLP
jgi:N-acetyl-gamma-glutamyl-phosphate reductase